MFGVFTDRFDRRKLIVVADIGRGLLERAIETHPRHFEEASNKLAALALSPEVRPRIIARTRAYIRRGFPVLEEWMAAHPGAFSYHPPDAAAIAFVRYHLDVNSTVLTERLRTEKSVLIVPGER